MKPSPYRWATPIHDATGVKGEDPYENRHGNDMAMHNAPMQLYDVLDVLYLFQFSVDHNDLVAGLDPNRPHLHARHGALCMAAVSLMREKLSNHEIMAIGEIMTIRRTVTLE